MWSDNSDNEEDGVLPRPSLARSLSGRATSVARMDMGLEEPYNGPEDIHSVDDIVQNMLNTYGVQSSTDESKNQPKKKSIPEETVKEIIESMKPHPVNEPKHFSSIDYPHLHSTLSTLFGHILLDDNGENAGFTVTKFDHCTSLAHQFIHCDHPYGIDPDVYAEHFPQSMACIATLSLTPDEEKCLTTYYSGPRPLFKNLTKQQYDAYMRMMHVKYTQNQDITYAPASIKMRAIISNSFTPFETPANTLNNYPYFYFHVGPNKPGENERPRYFLRARYHPNSMTLQHPYGEPRPPLRFVDDSQGPSYGRSNRASKTRPSHRRRRRSRRDRRKSRSSKRRGAPRSHRRRRKNSRRT